MLHVEEKALIFWSIFVYCINIVNTFKNKIAMTYQIKNPCQPFSLYWTFFTAEEVISFQHSILTSSNTDTSPKTQVERLKQFVIVNPTIKKKTTQTKTCPCLRGIYLPALDTRS